MMSDPIVFSNRNIVFDDPKLMDFNHPKEFHDPQVFNDPKEFDDPRYSMIPGIP